MGPLEIQMYVWVVTWLVLSGMLALAFFITED
ncbi:hypothetical protein P4a_00085 [Klebsiella phage VLCpiP4a]|nr:hypothetical protein P4a_00085 [Klebsiella phage VLCpiP4a]